MRSARGSAVAHWVISAIVYGFLVLPMLVVVAFSFSERSYFAFPHGGLSLRWYEAAWSSGRFLGPGVRSLVIALLSTMISAAVAIPATLGLRRLPSGRLRTSLEFVFLTPLVVPALIIGIALLYAYNRFALIDTFEGLLAAHILIVFPFVFRAVLTAVMNLRQQHLEASEVLGASQFYTFRRIVLPSITPGLVSGAIFAFIVSLDQFTVSLFVTQTQQEVLPVAIYKYLYDVNDPVVAAVSTVLVVFGLLVAFIIDRLGWMRHLGGAGS